MGSTPRNHAAVIGAMVLATGVLKLLIGGMFLMLLVMLVGLGDLLDDPGALEPGLAALLPWLKRDLIWTTPLQFVVGLGLIVGGALFMRRDRRARGLVEAACWLFAAFMGAWGALWVWRLATVADPAPSFRFFAGQNAVIFLSYAGAIVAFIVYLRRSAKVRAVFEDVKSPPAT